MGEPAARIAYEFDQFHVDPVQRLLRSRVDGEPIALTSKVFETLLYLVEHRGELVEKATLMKAIWPDVVVEENNLNQNISALRRTLGESALEHRFIVTVPSRGYRFVAEVRTLTIPARTSPQQQPATEASTALSTSQPTTTPTSRSSIAVLPFANLTGDPGKEYFSDGMAEELIHVLARVPGLRVPSRTSSFAYKGRSVDLRQIARDLQVGAVLEGSVRSAGERIRVTAQLVDGQTGFHLWTQNYDRRFEDLFELQDELAGAIVQALRVHTHADLPSAVSQAPPTQDLEAYELYLQARSLIVRSSAENLRTARELLQKATVRDPQFARAFALIGTAHINSFISGLSSDPQELVKAEQAARHALALDPDLVQAHATLASVNANRGNWLAARRDFEAALSLNTEDPRIYSSYALILMNVGHLREALQASREVDRLAPGVAGFATTVAGVSAILGLDADAVRYADRAVNLGASPDFPPLRIAYSNVARRRGNFGEAGAQMAKALPEEVRQAGGADAVKLIYAALGDASKKGAALDALGELRTNSAGMNSSLMVANSIVWCTMLGALDSAYAVANEGLDNLRRSGPVGFYWMGLWIPEMRSFRRDPRFQAFVDRLGLMEYWKQYGPPDDCELRNGKLICH